MGMVRFFKILTALALLSAVVLLAYMSGTALAPTASQEAILSVPVKATEPSEQTIAKVDACALVTKADAEKALGQPVKEPKTAGTPRGGASCSYETAMMDETYGVLLINVYPNGAGAYDVNKSMGSSEDLTGIGDKAYLQGDFEIDVLKNGVWLNIMQTGGPMSSEALKTVALKAVDRL